MAEPDPGAELDQPRLNRRNLGVDRDTLPSGRPLHQRRVTGGISRRQLHQPPGLVRQSRQLAGEAVLDPADQRRGAGQPEPARQVRRAQPARQLQQGERVPASLGDDQVADPRVQRHGQRHLQQRPRVIVLQPSDFQLGQPGQLRARIAGREHQPDRVGCQPTRSEPQRLCRGAVQPLLVIHQADQWPIRGHI